MKKSTKIMLALTTVLTASPVLITTGSMSASASVNYYNTNISVQGKSVSSPEHIDADDAGNLTAFLPLYYVNQALSQYGITGSWDGNVWTITTPQSMKVDLSNLPMSEQTNSSVLAMSINGTTVQYAPRQTAGDPTNGYQSTTYLPIWYINQVLNRLNINTSWDGVNWNLSFNGVQATLVKNVGVSGTKMVVASDGTLYVVTPEENIVKLSSDGNAEGMWQSEQRDITGMCISPDGQTLYVSGYTGVGPGNDGRTDYSGFTVNTADMSTDTNKYNLDDQDLALTQDGQTLYDLDLDIAGGIGYVNVNTGQGQRNLLISSIPDNSNHILVSPDGSTLYVGENANGTSHTLVEVNTLAETSQNETISAGYDGMLLSSDGSTIYLTNWGNTPEIMRFSTSSKSVVGNPITGGYLPRNDHPDGSILAMSGSLLFGVGIINGQKAVCIIDTSQNKVVGAVFNKGFGNIEAITASNNGNTLDILTDNGLYIYNVQTE